MFHFQDDQLVALDSQVETDGAGNVQEVAFTTEGFSVFAVVKHGTWTEAQLPDDVFTIITPEQSGRQTFDVGDNPANATTLDPNDVIVDADGLAPERSVVFKSVGHGYDYSKFAIKQKSDNSYHISNVRTGKYLSLKNGQLSYQSTPYEFKLYRNSKVDGALRIQSKADKYALAYDKAINQYIVVDEYELENEGETQFSFHQFISNAPVYRKLSNDEIRRINEGKFLIISNQEDRSLAPYLVPRGAGYGPNYFDAVTVNKAQNGNLTEYSMTTSSAGNFLHPHLWSISRNNDSSYYIRSDKGEYLTIEGDPNQIDGGFLKLVDPKIAETELDKDKYKFDIRYNDSSDYIKLSNRQKHGSRILGINLERRRDSDGENRSWFAWNENVAHNELHLAILEEDVPKFDWSHEEDLVEAIIPDSPDDPNGGDGSEITYYITNGISDRTLRSDFRRANVGVSYSSSVSGDELNLNLIEMNRSPWKIKRQSDGTYRLYSAYNDEYKMRLGDLNNSGTNYNSLVIGEDSHYPSRAQVDGQEIKIMTLKSDPSQFYISSKYGVLSYDTSRNLWVSNPNGMTEIKENGLSEPVRIYLKIGDRPPRLFTHQENVPTETLANISDGSYVIGHSPKFQDGNEDPEDSDFRNKQPVHILQNNQSTLSNLDGWIHFNERYSEAEDGENYQSYVIEAKPEGNAKIEWELEQSNEPGHYYLSIDGKYLNISTGELKVGNKEKLAIYKKEGTDDQVLITQGAYRLRYDGQWRVVKNSELLVSSDYHYLGEFVKERLYFELTNPEEEMGNEWLNNVQLTEAMWIDDLNGTLKTNIPKGASNKLGPAGEAYKYQYPDKTNPYANLYRLGQQAIDTDLLPESEQDYAYKEYLMLGWEITVEDTTYLVEIDAPIEKVQKGIEHEDGAVEEVAGIELKKEFLTVEGEPAKEWEMNEN